MKHQAPQSFLLATQLERYFLACSALVGAATLAGTQDASATIQYSGLQNLNVPTTNGQGGIYIDLETFQFHNAFDTGSGAGALASTWDVNFYQSDASGGSALRWYYNANASAISNSSARVAALAPGTLIDSSSGWTVEPSMTPEFANTTAFMGIQFRDNANLTQLYGWIRITGGAANGFPATIVDWAFDDSGAGILAGAVAVPEPGSVALGCLAAGAAGLVAWRKRKKN